MEHSSVLVRELLLASQPQSTSPLPAVSSQLIPTALRVSEGQIKQLCIKYRFRFLPFERYEKDMPSETVAQVLHWEQQLGTSLDLYIAAPSQAFRLDNADDPILMAKLPEGDYLYIDQWGGDISPWRRFAVWPLRSMATFVTTAFALTLMLQWLFFDVVASTQTFMPVIVFLFLFKSVVAVGGYVFFLMGKNFNDQIWNRPFYNN